MLKYKINVLEELKKRGYTTYRIRNDKIISERALQNIRESNPISWETLDKLCTLLKCQPNDIIEHVEDKQTIFTMKEFKTMIYGNIIALCKKREITIDELIIMLNIPEEEMQTIESNGFVGKETLKKIANFFNKSTTELNMGTIYMEMPNYKEMIK